MKPESATSQTLSSKELAVLKSVVYSSLFEYPLTPREVSFSLPGAGLKSAEVVAIYHQSKALQSVLNFQDNCFYLRDQSPCLSKRHRREAFSRDVLIRHQRMLQWIGLLPYTRLIALSGSSAHFNMSEKGDIDLFVVTRGRRVWSTAVNILLVSRLFGCREMVCFNYLVADTHLALRERDLFSANQLIHLRPLTGDEWMMRLRASNMWVEELYPNSLPAKDNPGILAVSPVLCTLKRCKEVVLSTGLAQVYEAVCRTLYRRYLLWKSPSWSTPEQVRLDPDVIKLHTESHSAAVMHRYHSELQRVLKQVSSAESSS